MSLEKRFALAAKLVEYRDTVRRLYGAEYAAKLQPYRELARAIAAKHGCPVLSAPMKVASQLDGMPMLMLIAASVDETEAGA